MLPELNTPIGFAGRDGFYWWVGQVESNSDPKKSNRYKVRIVGQHVMSCTAVDVSDLPWAVVMLPVTTPSREGNSNFTSAKLDKGDWVIGFFLDGERGQNPVILGSLQKVTNSSANTTSSPNAYGDPCLAFKRSFAATNPYIALPKDGTKPTDKVDKKPVTGNAASALLDATAGTKSETNPAGRYTCLAVADAACKDTDKKKSEFELVLAEFFGNVSNSGGTVGDKMLSNVTGTLVDYANAANGYISRVFTIARTYIGAAKAKLYSLIKKGISALLKFCLGIPTPDKPGKGANQPKTSSKTGVLGQLTTYLNELLANINCQIVDLEDAILNFLTELIFGLLEDVISAATCVIEAIISQILSELESFLTSTVSTILGILQDILGIIASPLNILSEALKYIFDLFGISCSGVDASCKKDEDKEYCTGKQKKKPGESDFAALDKLIADIGKDGVADLQTTCETSTTLPCPEPTTAYVTGGTQNPNTGGTTATLPTVTITANPASVAYNGSTTITWTSTNATSVTSSNFSATTVDGSIVVNNLTSDTTYDITVEGTDGTASANTVVFVGLQSPTSSGPSTPAATTATAPVNVTVSSSAPLTVTGNSSIISTISNIVSYVVSKTATVSIGPSSSSSYSYIPTVATTSLSSTSVSPTNAALSYSLTANKSQVTVSDSIAFTFEVVSGSVADGTVYDFLLFGSIQSSDFASNTAIGSMTMTNNIATVTVQTSSTFSFNGSKSVSFFVLQSGNSLAAYPFEMVNPVTTSTSSPNPPTQVTPTLCNVVVDANGSIMSIGICNTGTPYSVKPIINIAGEGIGASAVPVLDKDGYLTKVKVLRPGRGYVPNIAVATTNNCVIDDWVIIRPGVGYTSEPTVFVDGEGDVARARINDQGYITSIEVLNKTKTYNAFPTIQIIGGGGIGAKAIPSLGCLDTESYTEYVSNVAPSGVDSVIDCP